jgi:ketosteroid isomerase-like protein
MLETRSLPAAVAFPPESRIIRAVGDTNLELARSIYEDWERGDFSSADWAADDIEYVGVDGPVVGRWTGKAAMAETFRDFLSTWENWDVEAEEYRALDDERVLILFHFSARGKRSGLEVGQIWTKGATILHFHDGRVSRLVQYLDRDRALDELGLGES